MTAAHPSTRPLLLGAHTSASGGPEHALLQGAEIGATMIQLFTSPQRQWRARPLTQERMQRFQETREKTKMKKVMSHASYLINLGSPDGQARLKSQQAFRQEIERCQALGIDYLNFHPGAALQGGRAACLDHIVESLLKMQDLLEGGTPRLLVETTAGQGSLVGATFEEIGYLVEACKTRLPFGVCIDTCHIFAAGYDIRTPPDWEKTLDTFERQVGLHHLHAFHLNDSLHPLATHKDRHAPLGEGHIGMDSFVYLVSSVRTRHLPMCLETPGGPPRWKKEIAQLRALFPRTS